MSNTPYIPSEGPTRDPSFPERIVGRALDSFERFNEHSQAIFTGSLAVAGADTLVIAATAVESDNPAATVILVGSLVMAGTYARDAYDSFRTSRR